MPLIKPTLEAGILSLLTDLSTRTDNPEQARQDYARQLATLIDTYIKSATVTVTTAGTAAAQSGFGIIT